MILLPWIPGVVSASSSSYFLFNSVIILKLTCFSDPTIAAATTPREDCLVVVDIIWIIERITANLFGSFPTPLKISIHIFVKVIQLYYSEILNATATFLILKEAGIETTRLLFMLIGPLSLNFFSFCVRWMVDKI